MSLFRTLLRHAIAVCLALLTLALPAGATRGGSAAGLCRDAAAGAAQKTGVPLQILRAIMLTETGHRADDGTVQPWPWALNQGGESHYFDSRDAALAHLQAALDQGVSNIDLGCFQLNWRWHSQGFASAEAMLDPEGNALYAARLLARLYQDRGDWSAAAGAYHSATPDLAARYIARFDRILAGLDGDDATAPDAPQVPVGAGVQANRFPLLRAGTPAGLGSLVPLGQPVQRLIGG